MPDSTGFTQVFSGNLTFNGGGWYYITFNLINFDWDGTSNLEVFWKNWDGDYVTGYPTWRYNSQSPDYKTVYKQQDNTWPTSAGTRSYSRANLAIVTPSVNPPNPAIAIYPADAGYAFTDATLSWQDGGGMPSSYDVYLDTNYPPTMLVSDGQSGTTYTPDTPLTSGRTYYWQVIPRNTNGDAPGCPVWSFNTPGADQLAESFDDTNFPPVGWTSPGGAFARSTTTPFYGAASAYEYISTGPSYLYTSMLELTESSELDWWMRTSTTSGIGRAQIVYSTDATTWNNIGEEISLPTETTWMNYNVDLSSLSGNNYYIGFKVYSSTSSSSSFYIDHVFGPELAAIAPDPVTLTAPTDLATDISNRPTFAWTPGTAGGIPTGYRVYCDTNANPSTEIADVATPGYTAIDALAYNTTYYWKVVAYNGTGNSADSDIRSFTTMEDPTIYAMPWLEDFGTTGSPFPPTNWTLRSGLMVDPIELTTATSYWYQDDFANVVTDPTNESARMNIYGTTRKGWIISPPIDMPGAGYQLEFDIALTKYNNAEPPIDPTGYSGVDDRFAVLISDGSSWSTAHAVKIWDNDASTNGGIYEVYNDVPHTGSHWVLPLDSYTGIKHIAFYGESTVSNADNDFFVDNVMVRQTPFGAPDHVTLNTPEHLSTDIPKEAVMLSWTPAITGGTAAFYGVFVGEHRIDPDTSYYGEYYYETSDSYLDLSAQIDILLGYDSTWYWAVLPYNSENQSPDPEDPAFMIWEFTTAPDPTITSLPQEEYFDSVTAPALPYGWTAVVDASTTAAYVNTYSSTTYAVSAPNSVRLFNSTDAAANVMLITPEIGLPINTIKAKFYARGSTAGQVLLAGTVNPADNSFTQVGSIATTTTQTQYEVSFDSYAGADTHIAFKHGLGATSRTIYLDNVQLIELLANDLTATAVSNPGIMVAGTAYDFTVDVYNEGTAAQNAYAVKLMSGATTLATLNVNTPLASGASAQHTLSWTPTTGGVHEVYGKVVLAGDQYAGNDDSGTIELYILDSSMTVLSVGDDETTTSGYYLPIGMFHKNSVSEELYFSDELHLQTGTITAIVYKNTFASDLTGKAMKIWMAHTAVTDLTGGWLPAVDYTLVFDGTVDFPSGINYIVIPLNTPYVFTGGTLATRVNRPMDTAYYSSSDKFFYTTTPAHTNRSRYLVNDTTVYDPMAPSATGTAVGYVPNTMFVVQNAVMETGATLEGYVRDASNDPIAGATVSLTERAVTTTDALGFYQFIFWADTTVDVTAAKPTYYSQTVNNIALTMGNTVTQNFTLVAMPRVTVSGTVTANDFPGGIVGAEIALFGAENHSVLSGTGGAFTIPNVLGSNATLAYTIQVSKEGYQTYSSTLDVIESAVNLGTINLIEYLWTPYNLVATHSGDDAQLEWDPAGEPDYLFFDFEEDNGGWVGSGYGDWEWSNTYPSGGTFNWLEYGTSCVPPTAAYSGMGLWGTKLYTNYSNSGAWSYLSKTIDLAGFANPQLRFWRWNNANGSYDYYQVKVNGDIVLTEDAVNNNWVEKIVDLALYEGQTVEIQFALYASTVVAYAGLYIDDIYIGPATRNVPQMASRSGDRSFQNYNLYRFLADDESTPASWTTLQSAYGNTSYTDTGFDSLLGGKYKWAVKANYTGGLASDAVISNSLGRVYEPADIAAATVGTTVVLSWTAEPGANYYKIYASDNPYGTFTYLGYSATATYTVASPAAKKFYKVSAVADEAVPRFAPPAKSNK